MTSTHLNYESLVEFNRQYKKGILELHHLRDSKKHFQKFHFKQQEELIIGGDKIEFEGEEAIDVWGYVFVKDKEKFIVDLGDKKPGEVLPIKPTGWCEVSYKGDAYKYVTAYDKVKFRSEKRMDFKEMVERLTSPEYSNPKHQKLLMLTGIAQLYTRANMRVCSPPGAGKDSTLTTLQSLVGKCTTLTNPSTAKLELRLDNHWLVVNEMMDLGDAEWKRIEQILLTAGDFKPSVEKQGRSYKGSGEKFDISNLSLSIFYNDKSEYTGDDYFDDRAHGAVLDRFPAMRINGYFLERWAEIEKVNVVQFVRENLQWYKDLIYTFNYYNDNLLSEMNGYSTDLLYTLYPDLQKSNRKERCLLAILKVIDIYCSSQDEFNAWITVLFESMRDYEEMLRYDDLLKIASTKSSETLKKAKEQIEYENTYTGKNKLLKKIIDGEFSYSGSLEGYI